MKKYRLLALLLFACLLTGLFSVALAESQDIGLYDANDWFGKKIEEVGSKIEALGYKPDTDNKTGILKDVAWRFNNEKSAPYSIVAWFNTEGRDVTHITYHYKKDADTYKSITQSLTMLFGNPVYQEYSEERTSNQIRIKYESLNWSGTGFVYGIGFADKDDGSRGTMEDAKAGRTGFAINIIQTENNLNEYKDTPEPTDTPKPTPTLKPVNVEVSIDSVDIKDTKYGTRYFYIRFKNNASVNVDRIDFKVQGFNRYGERIVRYNVDTVDFYYDDVIKPGKTTPSNWRYNYYMLDEATKIKIAVIKYHTSDGKTVEIPEYHWQWFTYEMKKTK